MVSLYQLYFIALALLIPTVPSSTTQLLLNRCVAYPSVSFSILAGGKGGGGERKGRQECRISFTLSVYPGMYFDLALETLGLRINKRLRWQLTCRLRVTHCGG